jgi:hypothetical protein
LYDSVDLDLKRKAMHADGYSSGQTGNAVSASIRAVYPAAVPTMQEYLAMDDFLVRMWGRASNLRWPTLRRIQDSLSLR